jgi:hypothetical protein
MIRTFYKRQQKIVNCLTKYLCGDQVLLFLFICVYTATLSVCESWNDSKLITAKDAGKV